MREKKKKRKLGACGGGDVVRPLQLRKWETEGYEGRSRNSKAVDGGTVEVDTDDLEEVEVELDEFCSHIAHTVAELNLGQEGDGIVLRAQLDVRAEQQLLHLWGRGE